jgi:hypothetical protein
MTLDDGDYELVPEHEQGFSEDKVNIAEELPEASNQGSEVFDISDSNPTRKGKPRT